MLMQNVGGQTKSIMVFSEMAYKRLYYLSQLVGALWLVNFAGRILLYGPLKKFDHHFGARLINERHVINIFLTSFSLSVL